MVKSTSVYLLRISRHEHAAALEQIARSRSDPACPGLHTNANAARQRLETRLRAERVPASVIAREHHPQVALAFGAFEQIQRLFVFAQGHRHAAAIEQSHPEARLQVQRA